MKIGIIYQKFVSTGGLEGYLFRFAQELIAAGHRLHVFTGETDAATRGLDVELTEVDLPKSKTRALLAFERAVLERFDRSAIDASLGFGRTTRQDIHRAGAGCHAAYLPLLNPLKRAGFKSQVELALERDLYTAGRTRHFVVNSQLVREQLIEHYAVPEPSFTIIHTAVDRDRFRPAIDGVTRDALRKNFGVEDGRPVSLFVSRAHRRKGLPALLQAWPEIHRESGAQLWIVGPDIGRFTKGVPAALRDSISHFARVEDIVPFYQAADLFVHPSLYDACANTVLQSMSCGLPGVISTADGARQFVDHGESGWLLERPQDPQAVRDQVVEALRSGELQRAGRAARERTLPLTWEAHVAAWEETIANL